jgi:hypothetical protein
MKRMSHETRLRETAGKYRKHDDSRSSYLSDKSFGAIFRAVALSFGQHDVIANRRPLLLMWRSPVKNLAVRCTVSVCVVACTAVAALEILSAAQQVRTEDHNGDGRPDVWRRYDSRGRLIEVDVDSNFDGRPDVQEYYDRGALVRRESDRNFNGQADFVEEFDFDTHARTRSIIDIDYDGTADLLVLFRDGAPVFSKRTSQTGAGHPAASPAADQNGTVRLARMTDPFDADTAVRAERTRDSDECSGVSPPGGSCPIVFAVDPKPSVTRLVVGDPQPHSLSAPLRSSPRAPPIS